MRYFSNLFWYRTPRVLDRSAVHQQESSTVFTAKGIYHTGYADCLLVRSGWNRFHPDLASRQHHGCLQSTPLEKLKHVEFFTKINLRNSASRWILL